MVVKQSYKQQRAQYLARKHIPIEPCEVCGTTKKVHRHHPDYDKPLEVMFLCHEHHVDWHMNNVAINYESVSLRPSIKLVNRNVKSIDQSDLSYIQSL